MKVEMESKHHKQPSLCVKCSVFIGIHLMGIFCNVPWVWGNLSVYCSSYFNSQAGGEGETGEMAPWLVSINTIGLTVGVLTCDKIRQVISLRGTLALGISLFNCGVFLSYFSVQHSVVLLDFTLGLFPGLGMGIIQACQYTLVVRWTDHYQGLATSSVESTCVLGSVFINTIVTFYINPDNVVSDIEVGPTKLFSQPEILAKVPSVFLVYGTVSLCLNTIGFFLTREQQGDHLLLVALYKNIKICIGSKSTANSSTTTHNETSPLKPSSSTTSSAPITTQNSSIKDNNVIKESHPRNNNNNHHPVSSDVTKTGNDDVENCGSTNKHTLMDSIRSAELGLSFSQKGAIAATTTSTTQGTLSSCQDKGPRDILKTRVFYTLWLTMAVADFTFIILTTYYKAFGLLYIHDDHFLTSVGTLMCIGIAVISYAGGIAVDKFGVKDAIVAFISSMGIIASLFYLSPAIDKWIYLIFCTLYGAFVFGIVCVLSSCALKLWGQTHLSTNYGLVLSSCVITNTALPPLIQWIILSYGWLALFTTIAVCILCCVVMCVWQIPRT